ncbi:uncharacterized protein LOC113519121 isoform X2 [Galleria mellonella]|uniref:Uncharacterized protein LOC113519121 isoform X2 n=1 Tax=Galleria mellonella TaxID=7137 RepID=A0A6J3C4Z5_GALME|nr:uncharacterized protein LOC113519121 isoform X2 [Galleria mellonella]
MWTILFILSIITTINCHVLNKREVLEDGIQEPDTVRLQKEVNIVGYIQNFKHIMSEYVNSQYKLTANELERVNLILEEFLKNLATDLKDVMEKNIDWEKKKIEDGVDDEKFVEIKKKIMEEFHDIEENNADEMVYRLRKNLYETRQKLDGIIKDSNRAMKEISSE